MEAYAAFASGERCSMHQRWHAALSTAPVAATPSHVRIKQARGGRGRGRKRRGTVVERLARKLLSGRARDAATGEMLETEIATHRELYSNAWEEK